MTTKVIELINKEGIFPQKWKTREEVNQKAIDNIQDKVLKQLTPKDIAKHNNFAYSNSVKEYDSKPVNSKAVPEIIDFMNLMPNNGLVLDLGAGHFRDTLYMIDPKSRSKLNREDMDYSGLEKALNVIPLEISKEFLDSCYYKIAEHKQRVPAIIQGDFMKPGEGKIYSSTNNKLANMFTSGKLEPVLEGIWSCTAYMVHMVPEKLEKSAKGWAEGLNPGGIFAVSYINKKEDQSRMKFLASRSAPGEIKIFSHYNSQEVDKVFESAGLKLIDSSTGNYTGHGHIMKDFFNIAMYKKSK